MMIIEKSSEIEAITKSKMAGQRTVPAAQTGSVFRGGRCLVALKMAKLAESMASTTKLQLKLTPLNTSLARRTRIFCFYHHTHTHTHTNAHIKSAKSNSRKGSS